MNVNVTASDHDKIATCMYEVFDCLIRWQEPALGSGRPGHVGSDASYIAKYGAKMKPVLGNKEHLRANGRGAEPAPAHVVIRVTSGAISSVLN